MTLSANKTTIAAGAPYGIAGLGQHLAQIVDEAAAKEELECYYAPAIRPDDPRGRLVEIPAKDWLFRYTLLRFSQSWKTYIGAELFDRAVARRVGPGNRFVGFDGHSLHTFKKARELGYPTLVLESATAHIDHVFRQQEKAVRQHGTEAGWLNEALRKKTLREYEMADEIFVASEHTHGTFIAGGVPEAKLRRRTLRTQPRFRPAERIRDDGEFRIVAVGSLSVMKGTPVLVEAFSKLSNPDARLILVGGSGTRGMRQCMERWLSNDRRISVAPGDPLPHLQNADVLVHPSFTDGFGYAPAEALACGVPVIVTEETGMKEYVHEGENGFVVPVGDAGAILDRLDHIRRSPLVGAK